MKEYRVRILRRAQDDLLEIKQQSALVDRILKRIDSLCTFPNRGARPRDTYLRSKGYRFLVEEPFLIFYKVGESEVRIWRVIHGKRAYWRLL